jgi:hypothetical protein
MASDDLKALGLDVQSGKEDAPAIRLESNVRGFTGLLVGLAIGIACWGLILMVWWLV